MAELTPRERALFRRLSEDSDGRTLVGFLKKLVAEATNTRNIKGQDVNSFVLGGNVAARIIEVELIERIEAPKRNSEMAGVDEDEFT